MKDTPSARELSRYLDRIEERETERSNLSADMADVRKVNSSNREERLRRLDGERRSVGAEIVAIYSEAQANGFHVSTMRECLRLRRMLPHDRAEADARLATYRSALDL